MHELAFTASATPAPGSSPELSSRTDVDLLSSRTEAEADGVEEDDEEKDAAEDGKSAAEQSAEFEYGARHSCACAPYGRLGAG